MFTSNFLKLVFVTATTASIASATTQLPAQCDRFYVVKAGDTCNSICAQQRTSSFQIQALNVVINDDCTNLEVGQLLCLGIQGQDCTNIHVVQNGEIWLSIAAGAGISVDDLLANNPNIDAGCTNLEIGEVLCVAPRA